MRFIFLITLSALAVDWASAQTVPYCTASQQSGTVNVTSISWTAFPGGASPGLTATDCANIMAGTNTTTVANFYLPLANSTTVNITNNITINGTFDVPSGANGDNSTIQVSGSHTLHVTGNLGDASNNNINYNVVSSSDKIVVDGTLYGKNNNSFQGNGSISGGTLNVGNGASCGTPCPVSGGFQNCYSNGTQNGSFCVNSGALPITLASFNALAQNNQVDIRWSTSSELNFDYFNLEKSINGQDFFTLAKVKGHGTTNIREDYEAVDENPVIGYNYYRLTSVDFDNYQETFDMVAVKFSGRKKLALSPNPFNGSDINFNSNFDLSGAGTLTIFDSMGILVSSFEIPESNTTLHFASSLKTGVYIAKFSSPSFSDVTRLVVK